MKFQCKQFKQLAVCIIIPLAVGGLSALVTQQSMETFDTVIKPYLSPPAWLFPPVWTLLYILMGVASYLVLQSPKPYRVRSSWKFYILQLFFNFWWSVIFFNMQAYLAAFIWLILLWLLIIITTFMFYKTAKPAGYLMIPYIIWVTFAGYLNLGIYLLN